MFLNIACMKEIITALMIWLGANTHFDTNHDIPTVIFLPQDQLNTMYFKDHHEHTSTLHGLYNKDIDTIFLPDTWDRRSAWDMGVLLHEMIHYLQDVNGVEFLCDQQMERDAWPIQQDYLKQEHNYDWNYDELWYFLISSCNPSNL